MLGALSESFGKDLEVHEVFPNYYRCLDAGEAYSASFLITKEHLLQTKTSYNLTWVNCEMGSFIYLYQKSHSPKSPGGIVQSLDIFDLSVIHLSVYERLIKRYGRMIAKDHYIRNVTNKMTEVSNILKNTVHSRHNSIMTKKREKNELILDKLNRTVAMMPFLGFTNGAGHSVLANRFRYLDACFWSIYAYISHIIVAVNSKADYHYCRYESGLPFYDVLLLDDLPKPASLPVATSLTVKSRILNGTYNFDYFYFTESDQILLMRSPLILYEILEKYPRYALLPHRLMPYPDTVISRSVRRTPEFISDISFGWMNRSCCLPTGYQCRKRDSWVKISATQGKANTSFPSYPVPILPMFQLHVALGNANFLDELYRSCKLSDTRLDTCASSPTL